MNINLKNQSNIINNSKIKFKGQKLLQCFVFFASSNVNRVVNMCQNCHFLHNRIIFFESMALRRMCIN